MSSKHSPDAQVYAVDANRKVSMLELLETFSQLGLRRVSDLHLKVNTPPVYRVDGRLQPMNSPPLDKATAEALVHSLLPDREVEMLDKNRSVDSSFQTGSMHFRLNSFHENDGVAMAIRALEVEAPAVTDIGFPNRVWEDIIRKQQGLVLVTGVTGAGKSTTIASMLARIAETTPCRIITLEDPIEYILKSKVGMISQREVGRDVPNFERGIRDCLREDPDIIFVGEMRDRDSAAWTLTAAETGHLVFSTLHTRDVRGTITRVLDFFPSNQHDEVSSQLSLGLSHIISQKLIPRSDGQGRLVAMEILNNTYSVMNLIRTGKIEQLYSQLQTRTKDIPEERMVTMERSLAELVRTGTVSVLEAEKWVNHPSAFLDEMKRINEGK